MDGYLNRLLDLELLGSGPFFFGSADLVFGLEPVVEFRACLIASPEIEFVGSASDTFFEGARFPWGVLLQVRVLPWDHLRR